MEGAGKTKECGGIGEVRIGERRADKICAKKSGVRVRSMGAKRRLTGSVSGDVPTLVVTVQGEVETEVLSQVLIDPEAQHIRVIP